MSSFLLIGCSTANVRVMPGGSGTNRVISTDIEKDDAEKAAVDGAQEYCDKRHKQAVFVKEDTKYTGSMDENTRNTVRKASRIASVLGSQSRGYDPDQPGAIETAGSVGSGMTNDRDYKSEMSFKCE